MKLYVSRSSVAMGDDVYAPNEDFLTVQDGTTLKQIISEIQKSRYLPKIEGGEATWSAVSKIPIAVIAQQWVEPRMLSQLAHIGELDCRGGNLHLYFNYHAQIDPEIVYRVLWGFRLNAS